MTDEQHTTTASEGNWRAGFSGGVGPLLAVLVITGVVVAATNVVETWLFGGEAAGVAGHLFDIPPFGLLGGVAWLALRREGTRLRDVGLGRAQFLPAVVAVGVFVVATNLVALGLALRSGSPSFGFIYDDPPALVAAAAVSVYLFNGPVEELLTRGYIQNKLVTLLNGTDRRVRRTAGVLGASALFALVHVPTLLQQGASPAAIPFGLLPLFLTGVAFGAVYELTRNLYLVALLHGIGNYWPLFVDPGPWPNWPVLVVVYVLLVVGYRRWAWTPERRPHGVPG